MNETEKREKINYAKRQIKSFNYLISERKKSLDDIADVNSKLEGLGGPGYDETVSGHPYPYREADLRDKLIIYKRECDLYTRQIYRIENFLDGLDSNYRIAITDVYIKNKTFEETAIKIYESRSTMQRRIDELLLTF